MKKKIKRNPASKKKRRISLPLIGCIFTGALTLFGEIKDWDSVYTKIVLSVAGVFGAWAWWEHWLSSGKSRMSAFVGSVIIIVLVVVGIGLIPDTNLLRPLKPANEPIESYLKKAPRDLQTNEVVFLFGSCGVFLPLKTNRLPVIVTPTASGIVPLIEIALGKKGAMLSGQFFDKEGKIVAVLKDNKPITNSRIAFNVERPDNSTLIVHDENNTEVLNIRYLQPRAFLFTGTIRSPDGAEVIITDSHVTFRRGPMPATFHEVFYWGVAAIYLGMKGTGIGFGQF